MEQFFGESFKLGVLGGGQLGRMLIQAAVDFDVYVKVLDPDPKAPCHRLAHEFVCGSLTDYQTVMAFGQDVNVLTIEIENVNADALEALEAQGKKVFPQPHIIRMIQDKRAQKQFYRDNDIPTAPFYLIDKKSELEKYIDFLPAVQKMGKEGYDGRGVQVLRAPKDFEKAFEVPSLLESFVEMEKEIAIIISRNIDGEIAVFPAVELVYHEENLVDYLLGPAELTPTVAKEANRIARLLVERMDFVGILAVEMFVKHDGSVLVNEIAPRPHNSGHQTIEGNQTSQYVQHLRSVLNMPLGSTATRSASAMVNLLGAAKQTGPVHYLGLNELMAMEGVYIHLYGKKTTKPFRKMGHVTILANSRDELKEKIEQVKNTVKIVAAQH